MPKLTKVLLGLVLLGIFSVVSLMVITAAIHLMAPYVAFMIVLVFLLWFLSRYFSDEETEEVTSNQSAEPTEEAGEP